MKESLLARTNGTLGAKNKRVPKNEDPSELRREMRGIKRMLFKINSVLKEKKMDSQSESSSTSSLESESLTSE